MDQLAIDIAQLIHTKLDTIEAFTHHSYSDARAAIMRRAVRAAQALRARHTDLLGQRIADGEARAVIRVLFGEEHPPDTFWDTRLGVDIVWAIGYPKPDVPLWAVQAVLACSRGRVWDLLRRERIVSTDVSVRAYARGSARWMQRSDGMWFR